MSGHAVDALANEERHAGFEHAPQANEEHATQNCQPCLRTSGSSRQSGLRPAVLACCISETLNLFRRRVDAACPYRRDFAPTLLVDYTLYERENPAASAFSTVRQPERACDISVAWAIVVRPVSTRPSCSDRTRSESRSSERYPSLDNPFVTKEFAICRWNSK